MGIIHANLNFDCAKAVLNRLGISSAKNSNGVRTVLKRIEESGSAERKFKGGAGSAKHAAGLALVQKAMLKDPTLATRRIAKSVNFGQLTSPSF